MLSPRGDGGSPDDHEAHDPCSASGSLDVSSAPSVAQASQVCRTSDYSHVRSELECGGGSRRQASEKVENRSSWLAKSRIFSLHFTALHFTFASLTYMFAISYSIAPSLSSLYLQTPVIYALYLVVPGSNLWGVSKSSSCRARQDHRPFVASQF